MSCYHPLKAFRIGIHPNTGKPRYKITSYDINWIRLTSDGTWQCYTDGVPFGDYVSDSIDIPCGKCIGCRLAYSRDWANRCMLEASYHDECHFLTLTYDDAHLPENDIVDMRTGEVKQSPVHTLVPRDLQLFMKRLRKNSGQELRFFACGEYGSSTHRPHYHLIVFGLHLDDLTVLKSNFRGELYYRSSLVEKCWTYGYSMVCDVSWDTCAYVARYVVKKIKGAAAELYTDFNIVPPFVRMSLKPGIGRLYYDDHKDNIYKYDKIVMSTDKGGRVFRPPRYYDKLYDLEYPSDMDVIKQRRSAVAENIKINKLNKTDVDYLDYLSIEEDTLTARLGEIKERSTI